MTDRPDLIFHDVSASGPHDDVAAVVAAVQQAVARAMGTGSDTSVVRAAVRQAVARRSSR